MSTTRTVTITDPDGHIAGQGTVRWTGEAASIECDAILGGDQEAAEGIYEELEDALSGEAARPSGWTVCAGGWTISLGPLPCECGEATGVYCAGELGPDAVTVEWMPEHLRSSHEAAGNAGSWPANGAVRLRCTPACAARPSARTRCAR